MKKKNLIDTVVISTFFFIEELVFKALINNFTFDYSILRIFLLSTILGFIMSYIANLTNKKKIKMIIILVPCILTTIYALAQLGFIAYFGIYMSTNTGGQLGAVKSYILDFIKSLKPVYYTILIPIIPLIVYYSLKKVNQEKNKITKKEIFINLLVLVTLCSSYYATINLKFMQNKYQPISNKELFNYPSNPSTTVNQFGINGYLILDVKSLFQKKVELTYEVPRETITVTEKHFDDTTWNKIIDEEKNTLDNSLNNYFISRNQTIDNDYTGYFKDKNLIMIMLESTNEIAINEEYFPTLYKIYTEGWSWKNNYSPRNTCPTGNNEFSALTSLYSINNTCVARDYKNNTYFESLFNLFKNKGYDVSSYHNYTDQYYERTTLHKNLGSTYYGAKDLKIETSPIYGKWPSDIDLIKNSYPIFSANQKYFAFLTTVSSHAPYNRSSEYGDKYLDKFEDLDIPLDLKRYLSKLTEVDKALETLLQQLEESGTLKDTVIVLFGDHYPYAIDTKTIAKMLDYDVNSVDIDKTPFVIWNPKITPEVHEEYTSYINILPTIANLFDLDYDARLYMGEDLLNTDYQSIVIFPNGSWKNEIAYYNANNNKITYLSDVTYADEEIIKINKIVTSRLQMSTTTIKKNYFSYLGQKYKENGIDNPLSLYITETHEEEVS